MEDDSKQPRIQKLANPLQDSTVATFFAVVNPGFELQAQREVEEILDAGRIAVMTGGIQFDSTWGAVRLGQPSLKIASRVLVRVDQFGARDFQKLYRKVSNLPWEQWLKPKVGLSVRAASHTSRLRIKSGIEESVVEAFKKSFKMPPPRPTKEVMCLVRVEDDICTISLDLSGDLLHKRGSHTDVGTAPLRETWAASIVERAFEIAVTDEETKKAFQDQWQWIEPMAGTAVFLREALSQQSSAVKRSVSKIKPKSTNSEVKKPTREFAVDTCFKFEPAPEGEAVVTKPKTKVKSKVAATRETIDELVKGLTEAIIVDTDEKQLERGRKALKGLANDVELIFMTNSKPPKSEAKSDKKSDPKADKKSEPKSAAANPKSESKVPRMVFVNPPWGQRLKGKDSTDTTEGQTSLMAKIEAEWKPTLVAILFPRIAGKAPQVPKGWTEHLPLDFRAGGIPVKARFFTVKRG